MLKAVIVDDEILAVNLVENLLKERKEIEVVGTFNHPAEALKGIKQLKPHIIFLDIEMPNQNGISLAEQVAKVDEDIDIIFVTAYEHYAIDAFKVYAAGYLLKPLDRKSLFDMVDKLVKRRKTAFSNTHEALHLKAQFTGNFVLYNKQGHPIKWRTKKVKELCAYLLHHKKPMHRLQIIEDLWPQVSLEKAAPTLHTSIYQLRKELKNNGYEDALQYLDERYLLNLNLEEDIKLLPQNLETGMITDEELLSLIEDAEKGYLGNEDYNWSVVYTEKMREESKQFFEKYIIYYCKQKNKPAVWPSILEKLIDLDPFSEIYYRELIKYYISCGSTKKAKNIYRRLEYLLWEELREKPSEATKRAFKK